MFRDGWEPSQGGVGIAPRLLKLHGSSNWLTSAPIIDPRTHLIVPTQSSAPDTLYVFEKATKPYDCYDGRYMHGYAPFSCGYYPPNILDDKGRPVEKGRVLIRAIPRFPWVPRGTAGDSGLVSIPLIIPPVKEKRYSSFGTLFTTLWTSAQESLVAAEHIVLIGYSFPRTDHRSRTLFRDAFMVRETIPQITIVNPTPEPIVRLFTHDFGIPRDRVTVFAEPFVEGFDARQLVL